jgi:hypothetical protein
MGVHVTELTEPTNRAVNSRSIANPPHLKTRPKARQTEEWYHRSTARRVQPLHLPKIRRRYLRTVNKTTKYPDRAGIEVHLNVAPDPEGLLTLMSDPSPFPVPFLSSRNVLIPTTVCKIVVHIVLNRITRHNPYGSVTPCGPAIGFRPCTCVHSNFPSPSPPNMVTLFRSLAILPCLFAFCQPE